MTFVQLTPVYRAIFLGYRTATVNAIFLFITFERCIILVIMGVTKILA